MDITEISRRAAREAESVCREFLPQGQREGREWVFDPGAGKIKVVLSGDKAGTWAHFGGDERGGDMVDLVARMRGVSLGEAYRILLNFFGVKEPEFAGKKQKTWTRPKKPQQAAPPVRESPVESYLRGERGLYPETMAAFKVAEAAHMDWANEDGEVKKLRGPWILFPYFRVEEGKNALINIKWLHVERKVDEKSGKARKRTQQEKGAEPSLYGWQAANPNARHLVITEGEIDCMTVWQWAQEAGWKDSVAVLSVPMGCGSGHKQDWIEAEWDRLSVFDDIAVCFDADSAGENKTAMEEIVHRLGVHRTRIMKLPHKDPNDCLVKHGCTAEAFAGWWKAARPLEPEELKSASTFVEDVILKIYPKDEDHQGVGLPWSSIEWLRLRRREVTIITGINGHGKTVVLSQIVLHAADQGEPSCIASMEMQPANLLEGKVRQVARQRTPSVGMIRAIHEWFDGRIWIVNRMGAVSAARLLEVFLYARRRFGVRFFVIDSLMRCGIAEDDYNGQKEFVDKLMSFADSEDCHVVLVAHARKAKDESAPPGKMDVKGTGTIMDLVHNCLIVWRNKGKEQGLAEIQSNERLNHEKREEGRVDYLNKPDATLIVDKQRGGSGEEGRVRLWFEKDSRLFRDRREGSAPMLHSAPREKGEDLPF